MLTLVYICNLQVLIVKICTNKRLFFIPNVSSFLLQEDYEDLMGEAVFWDNPLPS